MERWSILNDIIKYVEYNQHPIGHYGLDVKVLDERYGSKMYKQLQDGERIIKEICFDPNSGKLKQDYIDISEGGKPDGTYTVNMMKILL